MAITSAPVAERYRSPDLAFVPISDLDAATLYLASDKRERRPQVAAMQRETASLIRGETEGENLAPLS